MPRPRRRPLPPLAMSATLLACSVAFGQASRPAGAWLDDQSVPAWNIPGARLPKPPRPTGESPTTGRCAGSIRRPAAPEDRAVIRAGWTLVGPLQSFPGTSSVSGASGFDGMCRPLGYQVFVFVDRTFAGTLSPTPMDARTDGAEILTRLFGTSELYAEFARYAEADPLCCPSRVSRVHYRIERHGGAPVVVAVEVVTEAVRH